MSQQKAIFPTIQTFAKRRHILLFLKFKRFQLSTKQALILLTTSIAIVQTLLHLFTINAYGFHEDELLYMVMGDHLAWGYKETGPMIAVIGNLSEWLFGNSLIAMRILPAICAGAIVHITGVLTIRLGGKYLAVIIACTAVAFSPAFLASGALFIPQVFDEFFWLLSAYLVVCWIQKPNDNYLYGLGAVVGFGILLKYTLILYVAGILIGIAFTPHLRILFKKKAFYLSVLTAFIILLPHLIWQLENSFPAFTHYRELKETQLNYLYRLDFIVQQFSVNGPAVVIWLFGIVYVFYTKRLTSYRFFGVAFLIVMAVLCLLKGKPYYGFGAYPPLFVVGAICFERLLSKANATKKQLLVLALVVPNLALSVIVLPMLPIQTAARVFGWASNNLGISFPIKWEDQKIHPINQNYADMIGWDELAQKTSSLYMSLSPAEREKTIVYTENYGIAAALDYYKDQFPMPKIVSLNGSFAVWAPSSINGKSIIFCGQDRLNPSNVNVDRVGAVSIANRFSALYGTHIYMLKKSSVQAYGNYYEEMHRFGKSTY